MYYSIDRSVRMKMIEHAIEEGMICDHEETKDEMMIMNVNVMQMA